MKKVVKFGGSSLASAEQFNKVGSIIKGDPDRKYVIPSARTCCISAMKQRNPVKILCRFWGRLKNGIARLSGDWDWIYLLMMNLRRLRQPSKIKRVKITQPPEVNI